MSKVITFLLSIGFLIMGTVQWVATYSFFRHYWDWHWLFSFFGSMFTAYTPILGSICGIIGAIKVWQWDMLPAILLFFWWPALVIIFSVFGAGIGAISDMFKRKTVRY